MLSRAEDIARALGGSRREGQSWRCQCPLHGGRSLCLRDGEDGRLLVKCWAGCDAHEVLAELHRMRLIADRRHLAPELHVPPQVQNDELRRVAAAQRIWSSTVVAKGTPVETYLGTRGLTLPTTGSLRWSPRCWHAATESFLPAMVAQVDHVHRGFVGVHRTYLAPNNTRLDRASLGLIRGGAVRLEALRADEWLAIAEGIETALSITEACGIPSWAALSASGMRTLVLPPEAANVLLCADNDDSGVGYRSAQDAANRFIAEGRRVRIAFPPARGTDFNDLLLGRDPKACEKEKHYDAA